MRILNVATSAGRRLSHKMQRNCILVLCLFHHCLHSRQLPSNLFLLLILLGTAVAQWLRCCVTNRKVAGSIPDGVIGIFLCYNPSDRTMALGSTQPLTEMSTRSISWGTGGRCVRLTTLPPSCAVVTKSGNLNFLEPSGSVQACNGTALPFMLSKLQYRWPDPSEPSDVFNLIF